MVQGNIVTQWRDPPPSKPSGAVRNHSYIFRFAVTFVETGRVLRLRETGFTVGTP